ncbi:MAG: hypothetical protein PHP57_05695 [Sideroxydans sp.]|nr:hypothetical protein [Sideroxydans sp.]
MKQRILVSVFGLILALATMGAARANELHDAAEAGDKTRAEALLNQGMDVNEKKVNSGFTPFIREQ